MISPFYAKIGLFLKQKKVISKFFFVISKFFLGDIKGGNVILSFFFWISRFFFWISCHISCFFLSNYQRIILIKNPKNGENDPNFRAMLKFGWLLSCSQPYIVLVKWVICKKTNLIVFLDVKWHRTLVILEKQKIRRICKLDRIHNKLFLLRTWKYVRLRSYNGNKYSIIFGINGDIIRIATLFLAE